MSHDDYTRTLAELQGGVSELTAAAIAGRRTDEAAQQLEGSRQRARTLVDDLRRRADVLSAALAVSIRVEDVI